MNEGRGSAVFDDLLCFEDANPVLDYAFEHDGLLMWPFVRASLFIEAIRAATSLEPAHAPEPRLGLAGDIRYLWRAARHSPFRALRPFDVVIFGSTVGIVLSQEGKWLGRVNDYFARELEERTLVVDQSHERRFKLPRRVKHFRFHDFLKIQCVVKARLLGRVSSRDERSVAGLIELLRARFRFPLRAGVLEELKARLFRLSTRLPFRHAAYGRFFEKARPKIVFLEDASYGTESHILKWAGDLGIPTGEFQHGAITSTHLAYNYAPALLRNEAFRRHLPDSLLTYGRFWSENTRTASEKWEIGNPHLVSRLEEVAARPRPERAERVTLVISQGDVTTLMADLARSLSTRMPGDRIVFRLHPREVAFEERYAVLRRSPNVSLSTSGDIYDLLHDADCVVGASSTALFEAVEFGKPVFVHDNESSRLSMPRSFGCWFRDAEELVDLIRGPHSQSPIPREYYWEQSWRKNYAEFLERRVFS